MFKRFGVLPGLYFEKPADNADDGKQETDEDPAPETKGDDKAKGVAQAEVNKLVGAARKQGGQTAVTAMYEKFGVKDEAELITLVESARKAETDKLSDKEKLEKLLADAKKQTETEKKAADDKVTAAMKRVQDTEIKIAASRAIADKAGKVTRPAFRPDALDDILILIDRSKIEEKEGKFEGVETALADLAKNKPWLLVEPVAPGKGTPGKGASSNLGSGNQKQNEERKPHFRSF